MAELFAAFEVHLQVNRSSTPLAFERATLKLRHPSPGDIIQDYNAD